MYFCITNFSILEKLHVSNLSLYTLVILVCNLSGYVPVFSVGSFENSVRYDIICPRQPTPAASTPRDVTGRLSRRFEGESENKTPGTQVLSTCLWKKEKLKKRAPRPGIEPGSSA